MLTALAGQKVCVTGGAGFLGRHLLPQLLQSGAEVTCIVRSRAANLPASVKRINADCADAGAIASAVQSQDTIIHMAGLLFGANWHAYLQANAAIAENIGQAAVQAGVQRVVFVSSLAAAGPCGTAPGRNEGIPPEPVSAYGWSKLMSEAVLGKHLGKRLVILRPPIIYGSGDKGLLPLFRSCARGFGVSPRHFPVSLIHASDCARAILLACGADASGVYHLNDGAMHTMDGICQAMAAAQGRSHVRVLHPPHCLMRLSAGLSTAACAAAAGIARLLGCQEPRPPAWNLDKYLESAQTGWLADAGKIGRELGFIPQTEIKAGMAEAVQGYRREGWL